RRTLVLRAWRKPVQRPDRSAERDDGDERADDDLAPGQMHAGHFLWIAAESHCPPIVVPARRERRAVVSVPLIDDITTFTPATCRGRRSGTSRTGADAPGRHSARAGSASGGHGACISPAPRGRA